MEDGWRAGLWLAVVASGLLHGVSPGMGWPLAVSAGLMARRGARGGDRAVLGAMIPIALGHFAAMALVLAPFAALVFLADWRREIQIGAGALVAGFGLWRLADRRHPRALARIPPARLALWSFAIAIAHGAGLLLVPVYLGLCGAAETPHAAGGAGTGLTAVAVAGVHALAMTGAAAAVALAVHRWLGLRFIARSWFDLDAAWALALIVAGGAGLATAL